MFGDVKIVIRRKNDVLVVPLQAVIDRDGRDVFFLVKDDKAVMIEPELDIREGNLISVSKGAELGDTIIVVGQQNVNSGDEVNITEEIE